MRRELLALLIAACSGAEEDEDEKEPPKPPAKGAYQFQVHVIEARDLTAKDLNGTSDPFVTVELSDQSGSGTVGAPPRCAACAAPRGARAPELGSAASQATHAARRSNPNLGLAAALIAAALSSFAGIYFEIIVKRKEARRAAASSSTTCSPLRGRRCRRLAWRASERRSPCAMAAARVASHRLRFRLSVPLRLSGTRAAR